MNRLAVLLLLLAGVTSAIASRTHDHVNGPLFADERIATYTASGPRTGAFTYYILSNNYSVTGHGNSDGSVIERLDYSSTGDFANGPGGFAHDAQPAGGDSDIDLLDFASLQVCFGATSGSCLVVHDYDTNQAADGVVDIDDALAFEGCWNGPDLPPTGCLVAASEGRSVTPTTGLFALHGRPLDVLPDGKILLDFRARVYDPQHGRWLQRDPLGYVDGGNLYEAFGSNAQRFNDPMGEAFGDWWDPRTHLHTWNALDEGIGYTLWDRPAQAVRSFHASDDPMAPPLGWTPRDVARSVEILIEELPAREIANREVTFAKYEGREIDASIGRTVQLWSMFHGGTTSMSDAGVGWHLASETRIDSPVDRAALAFGGVSQFAGTLAAFGAAPSTATQLTRFGTSAAVRTGLARALPTGARRQFMAFTFELGLREGVQTFGRGLVSESAGAPLAAAQPYNRFAGVREASAYLRSQGISRAKRVEILQSFVPGTIRVENAGEGLYAMRFYGTPARAEGQFLFETFTPLTNRANLSLPPQFNAMSGLRQWQIQPGTLTIRGRVAPQLQYGTQFVGGAEQIFVLEPWKYGTLVAPRY